MKPLRHFLWALIDIILAVPSPPTILPSRFFLYIILFPPQLLVLIYLSSSSSSFTPTSFKPFNLSIYPFIPFQQYRNSYLLLSSHQHWHSLSLMFLSAFLRLNSAYLSHSARVIQWPNPFPAPTRPKSSASPSFFLFSFFFDNKGSGGRGVTIVTPGYKKQLTTQ